MIYLIAQLAGWLLLTLAFAALMGWAFTAQRAAPAEMAMRRDRSKLLRDLTALAIGDRARLAPEDDSMRRMADLSSGRIAELERALETARAHANDASGRIAELERALERRTVEAAEMNRLAAEREREIDVEAEPVEEAEPAQDDVALQAWRLRYFEQRVRYLENNTPRPAVTPAAPAPVSPLMEWRAREAEARATYLENELRAATAPAATEAPAPTEEEETSAFAANTDIDMLLRWRMLYLERRVAYLQAQAVAEPEPMPAPEPTSVEATPDPDRWKWRARYLEARVRHLEQRPLAPVMAAAEPAPAAVEPEQDERAPAPPRADRKKPQVLPAPRNGAPDDFTLIEGVSLLQQSTLYSLGVFHFDQIAAWTPENVAWVDNYLRLRGRIEEEEWVEQADDLAREGPAAARRSLQDEDA